MIIKQLSSLMKTNILILLAILSSIIVSAQNDPYLWLEEVDSEKALEFVQNQNRITVDNLCKVKEYKNIYTKCLEIYNSKDRIAYPSIYGEYIYNFWQNKEHVRGIWRRSLKEKYINNNPEWEVLLDLDEMSMKDSVKWVYKGVNGLYPDYNRFIIRLSKGGGDATVKMEFDVEKKKFVENGFYIKESKSRVRYLDENTLLLSSDLDENEKTTSGYPRRVRLWERGTLLKESEIIYEGDTTDVISYGFTLRDGSEKYTMIGCRKTFYSGNTFAWVENKAIKLNIPNDCENHGILNNQLIIDLKSDWKVNEKIYKQGTLVSLDFKALLKGSIEIQLILQPDEFTSVSSVSRTKNKLLINLLTNVKSELHTYSFNNGKWNNKKVNAPEFGTISVIDTDEFSDKYFFTFKNFLTPTTLYFADAQNNDLKPCKSLPAYFDAGKYDVKQFTAKSKDGTLIPYFVVSPKNMKKNGENPTLLYAYGGFEISSRPFYSSTLGTAWFENGGVFVLANIRGGGEFGPKWHQAGLKEKRQNIYDDFHAVAEDLIEKKITSPKKLGIEGGSNGGLLVGVAFTQRPDLYNAVVCKVPLLDMKRYNKLLAGASWIGEYGNPDIPEEWNYIKEYSPYHNLKKDVEYPEVFFTTSTRDDRVHPAHARKMVSKMVDMGHPVYYYENTEGGHAGSSTNEQWAKSNALVYSYLLMKLKHTSTTP